jgi:hypothetical protein
VELLPIQSDSDCPSRDAVQAEVRELTTLEQRRAVPLDAQVAVSDRGESIRIAITRDGKTVVRVYRDAARDCQRRSHFVSVLVVVSLMPPAVFQDGEPEPEPEPARREPEPEPARSEPEPQRREPAREPAPTRPVAAAPRRVRIELGLRGELSTPISDSGRIASAGGMLAVALGSGDVRLTLATGYMPSAELAYTGDTAGHAELERLDVALGLRWVALHHPLGVSLDAGTLAMRAEMTGRSARRPTQDTAFSVGGRAGIQLSLAEPRLLSPFVGFYANVFPLAPALSQLPQGTVGHLPYAWLGLTGGVSLAL